MEKWKKWILIVTFVLVIIVVIILIYIYPIINPYEGPIGLEKYEVLIEEKNITKRLKLCDELTPFSYGHINGPVRLYVKTECYCDAAAFIVNIDYDTALEICKQIDIITQNITIPIDRTPTTNKCIQILNHTKGTGWFECS